jgi:hypothetical protein
MIIIDPTPLNMSEVKVLLGVGLPQFIEENAIRRIISTPTLEEAGKEMTAYWSGINSLICDEDELPGTRVRIEHICADVKAACLMFDASYMKLLGYTKLWFKDLTPGDTQISYEMWGEK